jgi:hypothetical protein
MKFVHYHKNTTPVFKKCPEGGGEFPIIRGKDASLGTFSFGGFLPYTLGKLPDFVTMYP